MFLQSDFAFRLQSCRAARPFHLRSLSLAGHRLCDQESWELWVVTHTNQTNKPTNTLRLWFDPYLCPSAVCFKSQSVSGQYRMLVRGGGYVWVESHCAVIPSVRASKARLRSYQPLCILCVTYILRWACILVFVPSLGPTPCKYLSCQDWGPNWEQGPALMRQNFIPEVLVRVRGKMWIVISLVSYSGVEEPSLLLSLDQTINRYLSWKCFNSRPVEKQHSTRILPSVLQWVTLFFVTFYYSTVLHKSCSRTASVSCKEKVKVKGADCD